jgi:hypothetical protein
LHIEVDIREVGRHRRHAAVPIPLTLGTDHQDVEKLVALLWHACDLGVKLSHVVDGIPRGVNAGTRLLVVGCFDEAEEK